MVPREIVLKLRENGVLVNSHSGVSKKVLFPCVFLILITNFGLRFGRWKQIRMFPAGPGDGRTGERASQPPQSTSQ